jgi:hypothetical protein
MSDISLKIAKLCFGGLTFYTGVLVSEKSYPLSYYSPASGVYTLFCIKAGLLSSVLFMYSGIGIIANTISKNNVVNVSIPINLGVALYILSII